MLSAQNKIIITAATINGDDEGFAFCFVPYVRREAGGCAFRHPIAWIFFVDVEAFLTGTGVIRVRGFACLAIDE